MTPLTLSNDHVSIAILPEIGGKITSLRSVVTGREWLWLNPHLPLRTPVYGASYVEDQDFGGWDEIFPSVSPVKIGDFEIPDHGDLAALPWELLAQTSTSIVMAVTTRFAPCRFERTLTLKGNILRADYRLTNLGDKTVPYLWCAHPLIALEPGMTIELPKGGAMRIDGGVGVTAASSFAWPQAQDLPSFDRIPDPAAPNFRPFAAKIFTARDAVGEVTITAPDRGEKLRLRWNPADAPYLGLWLNCHGWSGCGSAPYFNLGVEPATTPFDALDAAIKHGSERHLAPGESRAWSLLLEV